MDHKWNTCRGTEGAKQQYRAWGAVEIYDVPRTMHTRTVMVSMCKLGNGQWVYCHFDHGCPGSCCMWHEKHYAARTGLQAFQMHELELTNYRIARLQEEVEQQTALAAALTEDIMNQGR